MIDQPTQYIAWDGKSCTWPPPADWYRADDGRWYPNSAAPPQTGSGYGGPMAAMAQQQDQREWYRKKRYLIPVGLVALFTIIGLASGGGSDDGPGDEETAAGTELDEAPADAGTSTVATEAPVNTEPEGGEANDFVACTNIDGERYELEVVNQSPGTSSYSIDLAFFDDGGTRIGDTFEFVDHLRPGERAVEQRFAFIGTSFTSCELLNLDRFAAVSDEDELREVVCSITGEDAFGDVEGTATAVNETPKDSDYAITVAFIDTEGVRRGSTSTFIERVRPGEEAKTDLFATANFTAGMRCEVVGVERTASL